MRHSKESLTQAVMKQFENKKYISPKEADIISKNLDEYKEENVDSGIKYTLFGTYENVLDMLNYIFKNYHPAGYWTTIDNVTDIATEEGENYIKVIVSRLSSCE